MTGSPRPLPDPRQQCIAGWAVLIGSWVVAGVAAFTIGTRLASRWWEPAEKTK